jgi:uncharacterized protein YukE
MERFRLDISELGAMRSRLAGHLEAAVRSRAAALDKLRSHLHHNLDLTGSFGAARDMTNRYLQTKNAWDQLVGQLQTTLSDLDTKINKCSELYESADLTAAGRYAAIDEMFRPPQAAANTAPTAAPSTSSPMHALAGQGAPGTPISPAQSAPRTPPPPAAGGGAPVDTYGP